MKEPLEEYLQEFDSYQGKFEDLFETTIDLTRLESTALDVLLNPELLHAFRYLVGPPISLDDLKTLAAASSLSAKRLKDDEPLVRRIVRMIRDGLDRRRFPWVVDGREPDEAERNAAILASAALMAVQRTGTNRRNLGQKEQEARVEEALLAADVSKVSTRTVLTFNDAPEKGHFCRESHFGDRKADFIIRLWDSRVMPVECKVSNSSVNSVKRLNNDAAAKPEAWRSDFGALKSFPPRC